MKFIYGYKTSANEEREGEISASSRDAVYRQLKAQGIRPFKVVLAPGFGNWLASLGKRVYAIVVLCALCLVLCAVVIRTKHEAQGAADSPLPRHQIYGDPALMDELARTNYETVFVDPGLRILAHYAQPGAIVPAEVRNGADASAVGKCADAPVAFKDGEPRECRELKRIVLTMQAELKRYLANGKGTPERYVRRLNERQNREAQIYYTAQHDLEKKPTVERWEKINASLRAIGLKTFPMPEKAVSAGGKES